MANGGSEPFPLSVMHFQKTIKTSPLLETDLNKKMKTYMEQNIAAVSEFAQKVSKPRIYKTFGGFRQSLCKRSGRFSLSRRKT